MPGSFELPPFPPLPPFAPRKDANDTKSPANPGHNRRGLFVWLAIVTVIAVGAASGLIAHLLEEPDKSADVPTTTARVSTSAPAVSSQSEEKPWGRLQYAPIIITPPLETTAQNAHASAPIVWHVPNTDAKQLLSTLSAIGMDRVTREKLLAIVQENHALHGVFMHPPRELILGLSPESRAKLYAFLGGFSQNADQVNAFRFLGESPDEWLIPGSLPPEVDQLVRRLLYRHGRFMYFADLPTIEKDLPSAQVRSRLIQTLSRQKTILATLTITHAREVERLVRYWGRGGRTEEVRPILESLARLDGQHPLDIIHLLPSFARRHIYTYPQPRRTTKDGRYDCHWTTFNFFSEQADDRFCRADEVLRTLEQDYHRIDGAPQYGDVVMLVVNGGEVIHTAIYLADELVFTKNCNSSCHPWMLMKLEDLRSFFPAHQPTEIRFFRQSGF
jgi:hypothetical protein